MAVAGPVSARRWERFFSSFGASSGTAPFFLPGAGESPEIHLFSLKERSVALSRLKPVHLAPLFLLSSPRQVFPAHEAARCSVAVWFALVYDANSFSRRKRGALFFFFCELISAFLSFSLAPIQKIPFKSLSYVHFGA